MTPQLPSGASARRTPSILAQTLLSFSGQSSGYVASVITGIVVARALGPAGKGVATYATIFLAVLATFTQGIQQGVLYQCGHRQQDPGRVYGAGMQLSGAVIVPAVAILAVFALLHPANVELAYVACTLPFTVLNQLATGFFLLNNDIRATVIQGVINTVGVALVTIPAIVIFHAGVPAVLFISSLMIVCSGIYSFFRLSSYVPLLSLRSTRATLKELAWYSFRSGCSSLAGFLNLRIDVFIVKAMLDARTLGIYTLAIATGELMWQISRPLVWTTLARIASSDEKRAVDLTAIVSRNVLAVQILIGAFVFAVAPFAVRFVYGPAYSESADVVRWLMPGLILYAAHGSFGYFVAIKRNRPAATLAIQTVSIVACAIITVLTIHRLNIYGAALATSLTYGFMFVANAALFYRFTHESPLRFVLLQREDFARVHRLISGGLAKLRLCKTPPARVEP